MARFVNYQKRGVELPPGCKDLIDVLRRNRRAEAPGGFALGREPGAKPDLYPSSGIAQLERYVIRILLSDAKFATLTVSSLDEQFLLGLYRDSEPSAFDLVLFVLRKNEELERSIREFFGQRGIKHTLDYLCSGGLDPNYMRAIKYPLVPEATRVAQLVADLLAKVYCLDAGAGLAFLYDEAVG